MRSKRPVAFAAYEPDKGVASGTARVAKGVLSQSKRYAPLPRLQVYGPGVPLNDACLGGAGFYDSTGAPVTFVGDTGRLYRLTGKSPADVSKSGGYSADTDWAWGFEQFGDNIVAVARGPKPQRFVLGSSDTFADLENAPDGDVVFRIRQHLWICGGLTANWCAFNNITDWEPDFATQAGSTVLGQDAGIIVAGIGGEQGAIFQERGVTRVTYQGGDVPWVLDEVEGGRGACSPTAVRRWGTGAFVCAEDGFYFFDGIQAQPIGANRVDKTFVSELNYPHRARVTSAIDTGAKTWMIAYPAGSSSVCNKVLMYSWADDRWTHDDIDVQALFEMPRDGVDADDQEGIEALVGTAVADDIDISVDSSIWRESRRGWAAVTPERKVATFTGAPRAARVETGEFEPNAAIQTHVSEVWPITDAEPGHLTASVYVKPYRLGEKPVLADTAGMNETGCCEVRAEGRFMRCEVAIEPGAPWTEANGVHWDGEPAGER
jgi:hypothetical protein